MEILKHLQRQKTGVRPHQIIFKKKNKKNIDISWEDKMKPSIKLEDGITSKEYQALAARWDEMLSLAEEILWRNYLDPKSEEIPRWTPSPTSGISLGIIMWGMCPMAMSIGTKNTSPIKSRRGACGISTTTVKNG